MTVERRRAPAVNQQMSPAQVFRQRMRLTFHASGLASRVPWSGSGTRKNADWLPSYRRDGNFFAGNMIPDRCHSRRGGWDGYHGLPDRGVVRPVNQASAIDNYYTNGEGAKCGDCVFDICHAVKIRLPPLIRKRPKGPGMHGD